MGPCARRGDVGRDVAAWAAVAVVTTEVGMRKGVAGAVDRVTAAAATTTVGPLPQPSLRSHSRGSLLLSFFK